MTIGSIGGSTSFWQQDQDYWNNARSQNQSTSAENAVIDVMGSAMANEAKGLASIANATALKRVNSQLTAAIQNVLSGGTSSATAASATSASSSTATAAAPAVATGTAPVTTTTLLSTLGIPAGGSVLVGAGGNSTVYASTGSDTVGNLITALDQNAVGNAAVTAALNRNGDLVITSKNTNDTITISGIYASNIGFKPSNRTFKPTAASAGPSNTSASTSSSSQTAASSTSAASTTSTSKAVVPTSLSENISSAASILSASGASGSLVDMLT
jgi:hypothetical protein